MRLSFLGPAEALGTRGVAVKCIDITKNSDCEGRVPLRVPTLMLEGAGIKQD